MHRYICVGYFERGRVFKRLNTLIQLSTWWSTRVLFPLNFRGARDSTCTTFGPEVYCVRQVDFDQRIVLHCVDGGLWRPQKAGRAGPSPQAYPFTRWSSRVHPRPFVGVSQKSIFKRPCRFLAMNTHKMAPRTSKGLQERAWDAPT